jgi:hypothetical protein
MEISINKDQKHHEKHIYANTEMRKQSNASSPRSAERNSTCPNLPFAGGSSELSAAGCHCW